MLPSMITLGEPGAAREGLASAGIYWVEENTGTGEWDFGDKERLKFLSYNMHIPRSRKVCQQPKGQSCLVLETMEGWETQKDRKENATLSLELGFHRSNAGAGLLHCERAGEPLRAVIIGVTW